MTETEESALHRFNRFIYGEAIRREGRAASIDLDDLLQEGRLAVVLAVRSYDSTRGPLAPWAFLKIRNAMDRCIGTANRMYRKDGETVGDVPVMLPLSTLIPAPAQLTLERVMAKILMAKVSPRQQRILWERYWEGLTQDEVGARQKVTACRVSQIETSAVRVMRAGVSAKGTGVKVAGVRNG